MINRYLSHRVRATMYTVGIFIVTIISLLIMSGRWFKIENIEVHGYDIKLVTDDVKIPHNLLLFPSDKIRLQLLRDNPLLSDIRFIKKYPHTLVVEAIKRQPIAAIATENNILWTIDSSGIILTEGSSHEKLPIIYTNIAVFIPGEKITDSTLSSAMEFLEKVRDKITIDQIILRDSSLIQARSGKTDILIPQQTVSESLVNTLQNILAGFRIKGTLPTRIDLRFNKPVIVF